MVVICLIILILGVTGFMRLGREFIPALKEGTINCFVYMNPNVALDEIRKVCTEISRIAREVPEIKMLSLI
jgi:Cu/Ag efflux pump CusA